jgi:hypothetical protein
MHKVLSPLLDYSPKAEIPESRIKIPRNYTHPKATVRLAIPDNWIGAERQRKEINQVIGRRLGGEWVADWHQDRYPAFAEFRPLPKPPATVLFAESRAAIDRASDNQLFLGYAANDEPYYIDLAEPHVAISLRTGLGKSTIIRSLIAQSVNKGWHAEVIDPKYISQNALSGVIPIHRSIESQMKAIQQFAEEMNRRYAEIGESDTEYSGQRWILFGEEINTLISELKEYWRDYRGSLPSEERARTPRNNPALSDLSYIIYKGRACRMHFVACWQRMSANATPGGGDIRTQFGTKLLNCDPATWLMIVGSRPAPRPSKIRGRVIAVVADEETHVQSVFMTPAEAKEYALAGNAPGTDPGHIAPVINIEPGEPERYTLREACGQAQIIPIRYAAARRARTRDPQFPAGTPTRIGLAYTADELRLWYGNRRQGRKAA